MISGTIVYIDETRGPLEIKTWAFPGGERGVIVGPIVEETVREIKLYCKFKSSDDLIDLALISNSIRHQCAAPMHLEIPYYPYARQDKISAEGESLSLQSVSLMIWNMGFSHITVWDAHSDVLKAMFPAGFLRNIPQHAIHTKILEDRGFDPKTDALVSPDNGASKKIWKTANHFGATVLECSKERDSTGKIVRTNFQLPTPDFLSTYKSLWICDDICDGGATFMAIAKDLEKLTSARLNLLVTHGIFSRGLAVLETYFDEIVCANNLN